MASYTIVAIPSRDDYVWKVSSEKVPHMTLLFLGEQLENVEHVTSFIDHTIKQSLSKFALMVDRRGVLGDKSADVLFFDMAFNGNMLKDFRSYLLTNSDIKRAYDSTEQFPSWTPHLTMGYPETPAKLDNGVFSGESSVYFDRIALWTEGYDGVEFPLSIDEELSMSDKGAEFLEHYGVKGMRWGVVRDNASAVGKAGGKFIAEAYMPSKDAKNAKKIQVKAKLGGVRALNNHEMQQVIRRMELEQKYRDLYGENQLHDEAVSRAKRYAKKGARYAGNLITDILRDGGSSWIKRPGSNTSGQTSARARAWTNGQRFGDVIEGSVVESRAIGR